MMIKALIYSAILVNSLVSGFVPPSHIASSRANTLAFSGKDIISNNNHHQKSAFLHRLASTQNGDEVVVNKNSPATLDLMFKNFLQNLPQFSKEEETEEQRIKRLKMELREQLELCEVRRQEQVRKDSAVYLALFGLQFLPLIGHERGFSIIYFLGLAIGTVYLGGRQETITLDGAPDQTVTKESALYAPIGASVAIGGLYILIKNGFDPTTFYAVFVSLFGALAISDIGVPILRNVLPPSFATKEVEVPSSIAKKFELDPPTLPLDGLATLGLGLLCTAIYWAPIFDMTDKFIISNVIAWSLGMVSLGTISLGAFQTGAILLTGLFCYDIFWVFGTDVMMTVATKVEAPVKFLYQAPPSDIPREYPFSVLGLGDIVIPGLFVRFMNKVDEGLKPSTSISYFNAATIAYALGLSICFAVNEITKAGQPALLYLDPLIVGSAFAVAAANGQIKELWDFEVEVEEESTPQQN